MLRFAAGVLVLAGFALVLAFGVDWGGSPATAFPTQSELAFSGVTLGRAHASAPSSGSRDAAAAAAAKASGGARAIKEEYVHCIVPSGRAFDGDCWAVLVDPSGMSIGGLPPSSGHPNGLQAVPAKWAMVLVDPTSGRPIDAFSSSR